jgi:hypothetical protein
MQWGLHESGLGGIYFAVLMFSYRELRQPVAYAGRAALADVGRTYDGRV